MSNKYDGMSKTSQTMNIKIPDSLHSQVRIEAAISGKKIYEVVEEALIAYLDSKDQNTNNSSGGAA